MVTRDIIRFLLLLKIKKRLRSYVHLDICLSSNAFRLVQCPNNISTLHVESFLWYGGTILRNLHGWFLHLWRFIHSMFSPFRTCVSMCWEKSDTKLGEMPLQGKTWNCLGMKSPRKELKWIEPRLRLLLSFLCPNAWRIFASFLGHAGFYRRFIKDFSKIARPLTNLLAKDMPFTFDTECMNSWEKLKKELISANHISTGLV